MGREEGKGKRRKGKGGKEGKEREGQEFSS